MLRNGKPFRPVSASLTPLPATPSVLASAGDATELPVGVTPVDEDFFDDVGGFVDEANDLVDDSSADAVASTPHRLVVAQVPAALETPPAVAFSKAATSVVLKRPRPAVPRLSFTDAFKPDQAFEDFLQDRDERALPGFADSLPAVGGSFVLDDSPGAPGAPLTPRGVCLALCSDPRLGAAAASLAELAVPRPVFMPKLQGDSDSETEAPPASVVPPPRFSRHRMGALPRQWRSPSPPMVRQPLTSAFAHGSEA